MEMERNLEIWTKKIGDHVDITLPTPTNLYSPRNSVSERRIREDVRPSVSKINILDKDKLDNLDIESHILKNSSTKRIIGCKSVQILVWDIF